MQRPVLILGALDGVLTGIRQLRRTQPLETETISGLRVPTLAEKHWAPIVARVVLGGRRHTMTLLAQSRALWNRSRFDLDSDEILAQRLDRGDVLDWCELYRLSREDPALRQRIHRLILSVPIALPHFWLAALKSAGEDVVLDAETPPYLDRRVASVTNAQRQQCSPP